MRAEKQTRCVPIKENACCCNVVSKLRKMAAKEDQADDLQSRMFCDYTAEQIECFNMPPQKRMHPNDSFSMACGL